MKRSASAVWTGGLQDGKGTVSTDSGVLSNTPYNFRMRFENEKGTNPEELVAAAHAACFSMALSLFLGQAGMTAQSIDTKATVSLDKVGEGFKEAAPVQGNPLLRFCGCAFVSREETSSLQNGTRHSKIGISRGGS